MNTQTNMTRREESAPERTQSRPTVAPMVDIYENADEILLVADMPGIDRENVTIDLEKNQLTLTARRLAPNTSDPRAAEWAERDYFRTFLVPQGIDAEKINAELANGVLRVHLPKSAAVKPRKIEVRAG